MTFAFTRINSHQTLRTLSIRMLHEKVLVESEGKRKTCALFDSTAIVEDAT